MTARIPLDAETGAVGHRHHQWHVCFNSSTKLTEVVHLESGSDNTLLQNDLGLQVSMSKTLSISIAYEVKHNSSPPPALGEDRFAGDVQPDLRVPAIALAGAQDAGLVVAASRDPSRLRACRAASCPWRRRCAAWRARLSSTSPAAPACSRCAPRRLRAVRARRRFSSSLRVRVGTAMKWVEVVFSGARCAPYRKASPFFTYS